LEKEKWDEKRRKRGKKDIGRKYQDLEGVAFPSFLSHGGV
jgi:hypothetical protein